MIARMTETTRQKWRDRVREWRASGRTAAEFAEGKGYEASTLRWWSARLARAEGPRIVPLVARVAVAGAGITGIVRRSTPASDVDGQELVVEVGGARLRVTRSFDDALLGRVVRALQAGAR